MMSGSFMFPTNQSAPPRLPDSDEHIEGKPRALPVPAISGQGANTVPAWRASA